MKHFAGQSGPWVGRRSHLVRRLLVGRAHRGRCPLCEKNTFFLIKGTSGRDDGACWRCGSSARGRALVVALQEYFPHWRDLSLHHHGPSGAVAEKLFRECPRYLPSQYSIDLQRGEVRDGLRCEELGAQTFPPNRFDLVVTADVLEHIASPRDGFTEIARTLKPGGAHVFTVPWRPEEATVERTRLENGQLTHVKSPVYDCPQDEKKGGLVFTDWGYDLPQLIHSWSGMFTTVYRIRDRNLGIGGTRVDVFVSRKTPAAAPRV